MSEAKAKELDELGQVMITAFKSAVDAAGLDSSTLSDQDLLKGVEALGQGLEGKVVITPLNEHGFIEVG